MTYNKEEDIKRMALAILYTTCDHYGDPRPETPDLSLMSVLAKAALEASTAGQEVERLRELLSESEFLFAKAVEMSAKDRNKIEKMRKALEEIMELDGEINPSNYNHDDACYLNKQFCHAYEIAKQALAGQEGE